MIWPQFSASRNPRSGGNEIELGDHFHGGGDKLLTEFDWLMVTGDVQLAGTLTAHLIDRFELLVGMSFKILQVGIDASGKQHAPR